MRANYSDRSLLTLQNWALSSTGVLSGYLCASFRRALCYRGTCERSPQASRKWESRCVVSLAPIGSRPIASGIEALGAFSEGLLAVLPSRSAMWALSSTVVLAGFLFRRFRPALFGRSTCGRSFFWRCGSGSMGSIRLIIIGRARKPRSLLVVGNPS